MLESVREIAGSGDRVRCTLGRHASLDAEARTWVALHLAVRGFRRRAGDLRNGLDLELGPAGPAGADGAVGPAGAALRRPINRDTGTRSRDTSGQSASCPLGCGSLPGLPHCRCGAR